MQRQHLTRWQRLLLAYLIWKLSRPREVEKPKHPFMGLGGGVVDHDKLLNVTASQHHTKYTDAEAIAAVEGEPTLDLTGVIPDSAYPNALLLDGSRAMEGDLTMGNKTIFFGSSNAYIRGEVYGNQNVIRIKSEDEIFLSGNISMNQLILNSYLQFTADSDATKRMYMNNGLGFFVGDNWTWVEVARAYGDRNAAGSNPRFEISRAGDITMLTDKILENNGRVLFKNLPTSDPLVAGELWNDAGTVKVSSG